MVLLVGAGLFVRSLHNVSVMRLGYEPGKVDYVSLQMRGVKIDSAHKVALIQRLVDEARTIPGVEKRGDDGDAPLLDDVEHGVARGRDRYGGETGRVRSQCRDP